MKHSKLFKLMLSVSLVVFYLQGFGYTKSTFAVKQIKVSLVTDKEIASPVQHGLNKTKLTLQQKGILFEEAATVDKADGDILIVAGLGHGSGEAAKLLKFFNIAPPEAAESLLIKHTRWKGRKLLLISGADARGLMYALLDVADRIGWSTDKNKPLSEVRDITEKPYVPERALSIYTMQRKHVESFFYNEEYWAGYLDMLAENRFNTFALLFAYNPAVYLAPPYPYFFDVEGFPEIRFEGLTKQQQERNLKALNRIIDMTHERGLNFTVGIWDHIPHRNAKGKGVPVGLSRDKLIPYTKAAMTKFLKLVPELDAIQFRMHGESGLTKKEMEGFWPAVYQVIKDSGRDIRLDARAKNFPDHLIYKALDMGINIRMCTKYWMEQMGMPFHPTHIHPKNQHDRRHGYADMLRYPQRYKMHWKLWNGGTTRVFLWGDPDYVRRFARSTHLYDGEGFEINEMLATKMALYPDEEPFELLRPQYQYYDWEFERYWHFYQVFGRLGYNPDTPPDVWERQFEQRFGKKAALYVQRALHRASQILPRIVAYSYPYNLFPTMTGWPEMRRQEDLPKYAAALPSDTQQFLSMEQAAKNRLEGGESAKMLPSESSQWFAGVSEDVLKLVKMAEEQIGTNRNKEFDSTIVDLKMLANLALYHSWRAKAGVSWALFNRSNDLNALDDTIAYESKAVSAWEEIVKAAGNVYHDKMRFGRRMPPHWKDELVVLKKGMEKLEQQRKSFKPKTTGRAPVIAHVPIRKIQPGNGLMIKTTVSGSGPLKNVRAAYGKAGSDYKYINMKQTGQFLYQVVVPGLQVCEDLNYFIEAADQSGQKVLYPSKGREDPIHVVVSKDNEAPVVEHEPIISAPAKKPLTVTATVRDSSGVKWVRLRYRAVNQYFDYETLPMHQTDKKNVYKVVVPVEHIKEKWDFMYLIEVMDNKGNGSIYPDLEKETPYVVVKLQRGKK